MTRHRIYLLLHVLGAILWVGRGRWLRQLLLASYLDLGVLLPVLTATALKPGRSDRAAVALVAVLPVAGAVAGSLVARLAAARIRASAATVGVS